MWTSERNRNLPAREAAAELGTVTLGGDPAGVSLGGERRWLTVYGPGGYSWRPTSGDKVLVLKAGAEGESPCILGTTQGEGELRPGEVRLAGGASGVYLSQTGLELTAGEECALALRQGQAELTGELYLNGRSLHDVIADVVIELLG